MGKRKKGFSIALKTLLFLLAFPMLPLCVAELRVFRSLAVFCPEDASVLSLPTSYGSLAAGALLCAALFIALMRYPRAYVFAHEMTHAAFGLLTGAKVSKLKVGGNKGSVSITNPNMIELLAPYFFPLYAMTLLAVFGVVSLFVPLVGTAFGRGCAVAVGFAWGFHLCWTVDALLLHQTDLDKFGFFFSIVFIVAVLSLMLQLTIVAVCPIGIARYFELFGEALSDTFSFTVDFIRGVRI